MSNATVDRLSRGDRRRNQRLGRLREAVPETNAVLGIDLAQAKQACVVCAPDHRVLARRIFCHSVWGIDQMVAWAWAVAEREGLGLTVACEPTGHRWKPVLERCTRRQITLVCVQPLLVHRSREHDDLTHDRSDPKDATLIARLARELRCYLPVAPEPDWARLRHPGDPPGRQAHRRHRGPSAAPRPAGELLAGGAGVRRRRARLPDPARLPAGNGRSRPAAADAL